MKFKNLPHQDLLPNVPGLKPCSKARRPQIETKAREKGNDRTFNSFLDI